MTDDSSGPRSPNDRAARESLPGSEPTDAHAAPHDVRAAERVLRAVFDGALDAMLLADDHGVYVDANPAACELFGVPRSQLIGRRPHDFTDNDPTNTWGAFREAGEMRGHFALRRPDGTTRDLEFSATADILPGLHFSSLRDVTERNVAQREERRATQALHASEQRYRALLEHAPAPMAVMRGPRHVFDLVNAAYRDLVGTRDLLGRPAAEALSAAVGPDFVEILDAVLSTGEPYTATGLSFPARRGPDGTQGARTVNFLFQPLIGADGTPVGVFALGVDVTDEALAQRRVRAQFNGNPVPTYVWQRSATNSRSRLTLVDFNDAALRVSRGGVARFVGTSADEYFSDKSGITADLWRCLETGESFQREMDHSPRSGGRARRLLVTYVYSPPDIVLAHTEDVTESRRLENQARQSQKMEAIGQLAGGIAHDFNNLLSVILGYCAMAIDDLDSTDPTRADLEEVHRAGERAGELTRQLLAFSRQQVLQPRVMNLNATLASIEKMLRRLLGEDIALSLVTTREVVEVFADPGQVEQVIVNLAVNARDAMPMGGTLTIETMNVERGVVRADDMAIEPGPYAQLSVADTGVGMDAATCARVFDPFFTTKGLGKGTGLGLATVQGIVHQSGGGVSVESALGCGTTFRVHLPRASGAVAAPSTPAPPDNAGGGSETILLVEDEDAVRALVRVILRRAGYRVLEAQNGGEAFLLSEQHDDRIDLVLTDVVMPRMSGRLVVERLQASRPDLRALYMSGYTDDAVLRHGVLAASVSFIQKPITRESLLHAVRAELDNDRA